jgi:hypothetical protein
MIFHINQFTKTHILFKKCKWFQMFETPECKATNTQRVGKYIKHI